MLICKYPDGSQKKINRILLPLARKSLTQEYEKRRADFSDAVNEELIADTETTLVNPKRLTPRQEEVLEGIKKNMSRMEMAEKMQVSLARIGDIVKELKLRGFDFSINKDGNRIYYPEIRKWQFYTKVNV